ncbi:hypothetical protein [Desulfogranum marinum]|uniref:hypothetical protein n=1 Tax=Desulfogranum marinum TaxID=453220 RepID=UPI00196564D3|nr:hypothetical protein [Desulfogranum marinum]MBM9512291.1 hypothetical protein [Desulfogranum marinum]
MYNVLLFGLHSNLEEIESHLPSSICKQLVIQSATDFYSTAFSRIFDGWFINKDHEEFKEISLEELVNVQNVPLIFLIGVNGLFWVVEMESHHFLRTKKLDDCQKGG